MTDSDDCRRNKTNKERIVDAADELIADYTQPRTGTDRKMVDFLMAVRDEYQRQVDFDKARERRTGGPEQS